MNAADVTRAAFFFDEELPGGATRATMHVALPIDIGDMTTTTGGDNSDRDCRVSFAVNHVTLLLIEHAPVHERAATALSAVGDMIDDEPLRENPPGYLALRAVVALRLRRGRAKV